MNLDFLRIVSYPMRALSMLWSAKPRIYATGSIIYRKGWFKHACKGHVSACTRSGATRSHLTPGLEW